MKTRNVIKTAAFVLAAAGAMTAPAAFAAADDVKVTIDTRYLETDWGVEKVYKTLTTKAESVCETGSMRDVSNFRAERDCMSNLLDEFIASADHETLTSYHARMTN